MKGILLLWILLSLTVVDAQAPAIQWQRVWGGPNDEDPGEMITTADGGFAIIGSSNSAEGIFSGNHGGYDVSVIKMSAVGAIQWQRSYGGSADDYGKSMRQTDDGGFVLAGLTGSNDTDVSGNHGASDYWIVKINSAGDIQWQKCLGGSENDQAGSIQVTIDGGFVVAGYSLSSNYDRLPLDGPGLNRWIVKLSPIGQIQWHRSFYASNYSLQTGVPIQQTPDGGFIVGSSNSFPEIDGQYMATRLNPSGVIEWQKFYGGSATDNLADVRPTADLGYIMTGGSGSDDLDVSGHHGTDQNPDCWVVKINAAGTIQWQKSFGGTNSDFGTAITQTAEGGYLMSGFTASDDGDVSGSHGAAGDNWVLRLNASGEILWQKCLGGSNYDIGMRILQTTEGYAVFGRSASWDGDLPANYGSYDFWMLKLDNELANVLQSGDKISIYPNPVSDVVNIAGVEPGQISIYDFSGKLAYISKDPTSTIDLSDLASGQYILIVSAEGKNSAFHLLKK